MVARSFVAFDSENLTVVSSTNGTIVGNPIINNSDTPDGTVFTFTGGGGANVTIDDAGFFADNIAADNNLFFNDDEAADHIVIDGDNIVATGTQVEAESIITLRELGANGQPTGPEITITVFSQNGVTQDVWGFSTDTLLVPGTSYIKTGGSNTGSTRYTDFVTCFGPGTLVATPQGQRPVEAMARGDLVWTLQNGYMPVLWSSTTTIEGAGVFAPVIFSPGSIGNTTELVLSQEHRVYLRSAHAELLFGTDEVLVAAKHLCGLPGVSIIPCPTISYTHFMFDSHQIVETNGSLTESFFLSKLSASGTNRSQKRELMALFPNIANGSEVYGTTAARTLKEYEAGVLRQNLSLGEKNNLIQETSGAR